MYSTCDEPLPHYILWPQYSNFSNHFYVPHIFVLPTIINEIMCSEAVSGFVGLSSHPKVNSHSGYVKAPTWFLFRHKNLKRKYILGAG